MESYYGFEEKSFLALKFSRNCISYFTLLFFFIFFFQTAGGSLAVENLKAGACKRGGEANGRPLLTGSDVKHPGEMFVILMGNHQGNSSQRLPRLCAA